MKLKDAINTIVGIMCTADGECSICAKQLCKQLISAYPELSEDIKKKFCSFFDVDEFEDN